MKKYILGICVLVSCGLQAQKKVGELFPIQLIEKYNPQSDATIVVLAPSLASDNSYAPMLTTSLKYYFTDGLAFQQQENKPKIEVIYVVNALAPNTSQPRNSWEAPFVQDNRMYDPTGMVYRALGVDVFQMKTSHFGQQLSLSSQEETPSSIVYLLDKNYKILAIDKDYRAQGEHLKPLEDKIKIHLGLLKNTRPSKQTPLKIGEKAPDFLLEDVEDTSGRARNLSSITDKFKVITFYPAAFSGEVVSDFAKVNHTAGMSCATQIQLIDHHPAMKEVEMYAISSSTPALLKLWKKALKTDRIIYLNDEDYSIARLYNAYNPLGYSNRATYILSKDNTVLYANDNFTFEDEERFPSILEELIKKHS
ncbi:MULTISPECIES: redoxin domain-containing protein [Weeksella]|uniref:Alkyl hydroperoxide reductase/ Thiol specific antioxidant/ Mal allergen n=1 Tax=Weeksella virosa (strain ATCC 43766 / DSM 16922 / JCM 21250 / CCUG 30538 / CDC 9751 / IAM 14551 / NBRC 16016 / NCTC 11634 / CL345/78) TaxID=865938 RepID=F0P249_WEEVC|nr:MULTISPECIES: redoxin domain-containing protein [Weeksella]ADX68777.1 alkyl hydroperoxide reductase/ Thiol specific antioxidant/ Mal allergen [Weeksella virosa DSM 16922]MDK7374727.1 redoxin domain-containing protein [Weeksella virosa]MDK7675182.1 redoxin domain-containing protein [Weeksella virosa]OFM85405.1 hypothetical protein HMPREF2660_07555 [Weeksella sp. HMSC059D05]VEH63550.1 AhpC/TSA family [Weeksella virosa]